MPIHHGKDKKGEYYQWGNKKKYYYKKNNYISKIEAYEKAVKQAQAIYSSGYKKR